MSSTNGDPEENSDSTEGRPRSMLQPGTLVNGLYRLVRLIGVGGMGEVWEARHERTKGRVALKLLLPEMGRHEQVLQRFQHEVEITSALNHPNIVRVSDADALPDGRPFLVMEFLDGRDLSRICQNGPPLTLPEVIDIVEQTAMGVHAAHGASIVHRDLKPANIFLVPSPGSSRVLVKVLDFGISKALNGISKLTNTRNVLGTPQYMAPEQATRGGDALDARADQFSLAAITYELLTGQMAFAGDGIANVIYRVVNEAPPSFASLGVTAAPGLEAAVLRGLAKSPGDRFPSVMEFSDALKRAAGYQTDADRRPGTPSLAPPPTRPATAVLAPPSTTLTGSVGQMSPRRGKSVLRRTLFVGAAGAALTLTVLGAISLRGPSTTRSAAHPGPAVTRDGVAPARTPTPDVEHIQVRLNDLPTMETAPAASDHQNQKIKSLPQLTDPLKAGNRASSTPAASHAAQKPAARPSQQPPAPRKSPHPGPLNEDL